MAVPRLFRVTDAKTIRALIEQHPLGMIVGARAPSEVAYAPCVLSEDGSRLRFHLSSRNAVNPALVPGKGALIAFRGPDAYVSASWYENPARQVPTWNYAVVHAQCTVARSFVGKELLELVRELSTRFEGAAAGNGPWSLDQVDPTEVDDMLAAIVGFELSIDGFDARFKLSQNRSTEDHERVRRVFAQSNDPIHRELAELMAQTRPAQA